MGISEIYKNIITPSQPSGVTTPGKTDAQKPQPGKPSEFENILKTTTQSADLKLSQHAQTRIKSRQIPWDDKIQNRIKEGLDSAQAKGAKEALILADKVAVIANVKSRTIVTAMDAEQLKGRIFTNIDSAVLV